MLRIMEVVPYDLKWPAEFAAEDKLLKAAFGGNCVEIYHIGSTSVPGLAAKAIIDLMSVVQDLSKIDDSKLIALGYTPRREMGMPFRGYYYKGNPTHTHHLHVWQEGNPEIQKHLLFKEFLISNPDYAAKYADLKYKLSKQYRTDQKNYTKSKDALIKEIIQKSGFTGLTIVRVLLASELEAYHRIKRTQIFDPLPNIIYDPNHSTLQDENHYHYVLMRGIIPVAIAQVEFLDQEFAILRALATDEPYKNQGYGSYLLILMERWVKQNGRIKILMHVAPKAELFYRKRGYVDMEFDEIGINPKEIDLGKIL